ncbi:MAG: hypothetical protein SFV23_21575 [Planctomycetaceae bacterium]|nr:hypothetical protein [Planctomycetaceae bacterium]
MLGQIRYAGILVAALTIMGTADQAHAAVNNKTYGITVVSTVSGIFNGVLFFSEQNNAVQRQGTFFLDTEDDGRGTYDQDILGLTLTAAGSDGDDYQGRFLAISIGNLLIGSGAGNASDVFVFFGRVTP